MIEAILEVLREQRYENSPTVKELKNFDGLKDINAELKDQAWAKYQEELKVKTDTDTNETGESDSNLPDNLSVIAQFQAKDDAAAAAVKSDAQTQTTDTTSTTVPNEQLAAVAGPTHVVTVKTDGFRRLGRAWKGATRVTLTDEEVAVLDADPMFSVSEL